MAKYHQEGGINELALIVWHTHIKLFVMNENAVHAKATDEQVKVACHEATLEGLPQGPVKKTMVVFVVRNRKHFYIATTINQNGKKQAVFNIGVRPKIALSRS